MNGNKPVRKRKLGANVLYSDGTVRRLTTGEAEKLFAEQSPVPLKLQKNDDRTGQEEHKP